MKEAILDKYTTKTLKPTTTFKEGTVVIDGMWITENVVLSKEGTILLVLAEITAGYGVISQSQASWEV